MTKMDITRSGLIRGAAVALAAQVLRPSPAAAITPDEIKAKGVAVIGVQMDQYPWGFINATGRNEGFDIDVAELIATEMGVRPQYARITGQNRIPLLTSGTVDFLVPSMTITEERAKVIQFVLPYSANDITLWGRKDLVMRDVSDLARYTIGVNRGSVFDPILVRAAPAGTRVRRFDDDASTVQALLAGQVEAILGSVTYGLVIANTGNSERYERKFKVADNYQGMAVRRGDVRLLEWLNDFVRRKGADGTLDALYKKWIGVDRPEIPTTLPGVSFTGE